MIFYLICLAVLVGGGLLSLLCSSREKISSAIGSGSTVIAAILGILAALQVLASPQALVWKVQWSLPLGSLFLKIDALSAFFLILIFVISILITVYSSAYLRPFAAKRNLGVPRLFTNFLIAGMAIVVTAANGILFVIAWEIMSFAAYFLVVFEDNEKRVQRAGLIYLIATHIGTAFLFFMFWLLATYSGGSMDFDAFVNIHGVSPHIIQSVFILSIIGFGSKAGFIPFHVWLPEAHPAAPSHISALMSGVMIKTGVYGLLRVLTFLGKPPLWFGETLIVIGLVSGILAVLFAMAQHDLKSLLAYHSVENIGIILLGFGIGVMGIAYDVPAMAVLGCAGGLLHIFNHGVFKSLLFMGAGAVQQQTLTRNVELLGGLVKKMPFTSGSFITGAAAISGIPPLNGFFSEFLIYLASLKGLVSLSKAETAFPLAVILGLALIGGLAVACFTKATGIVFLGQPRSRAASRARECHWLMYVPMIVLAGLCFIIGIFPFLVIPVLKPVIVSVSGLTLPQVELGLSQALHSFYSVFKIAMIIFSACGLLFLVRRFLLSKRNVKQAGTWNCGYLETSSREQYTASSFVQPITDSTDWLLRTKKEIDYPSGHFPSESHFSTHTYDIFMIKFYQPMFSAVSWLFSRLQWLQHGRLPLYLVYIAATLLVLLLWYGGIQ